MPTRGSRELPPAGKKTEAALDRLERFENPDWLFAW